MVRAGHRAAIAFFIHREDVSAFDAAWEIDPEYAQELDSAVQNGVELLPLKVHLDVSEDSAGKWILGWHLSGLLPWTRRFSQMPGL